MSNLAAVIPAAKAPLEVQEVETYKPGPDEILVKNEVIAFNPVEFKIAKLAIFPIQYPAVLGSTFAGTVEAVGDKVTKSKVGDKVVVFKTAPVTGKQYGAYQRYVVVKDEVTNLISKIPAEVGLATPASLMMNLTCVVGLFSGRLGLDKPSLDGPASATKNQKVLIYGGSSQFGSLGVQYLSRAGYKVITTSSSKNQDFVSKLGATKVIDHTQKSDALIKDLTAEGPYDIVVDMISLPNTVPVTSQVLAAQGGGKLYTLQPAFGPETLPEGVERVFDSWPNPLFEEKNHDLLNWTLETYLPQGLVQGTITPTPIEKVSGGLKGVNDALDKMMKGVSNVKLVADPWE